MKVAEICVGLTAVLVCTSGSCSAQMMSPIVEHKTPIERVLQRELPMPGFGISASRNQIMNRLEYALEHKWLTGAQVQQLCNDLKIISDREESCRDENRKLSYAATATLAKQLNGLNERFEEMVFQREQSGSDLDALRARRSLMVQRVSKAESDGVLTSKKAQELSSEINSVTTPLNRTRINSEESQTITAHLADLKKRIDEQVNAASIASKESPSNKTQGETKTAATTVAGTKNPPGTTTAVATKSTVVNSSVATNSPAGSNSAATKSAVAPKTFSATRSLSATKSLIAAKLRPGTKAPSTIPAKKTAVAQTVSQAEIDAASTPTLRPAIDAPPVAPSPTESKAQEAAIKSFTTKVKAPFASLSPSKLKEKFQNLKKQIM